MFFANCGKSLYIRNVTEIIASEVEFLTPKASSNDEEASVVSVRRDRPQLEAIDDNQLPF